MSVDHSQENPEVLQRAVFGKYVEDFWDSDLGQYLLQRALAEYNAALEEFQSCDTTNIAETTRIQSRMKRSAEFRNWLSVAIADGARALNILRGIDDDDQS